MSKLENLIKKLSPNGVEYKELKEICEFRNGYTFESSRFLKSGDAIIRIANIFDGKVNLENAKYFNKSDYPNCNFEKFIVKKNDILIAMSGSSVGKIGIYNYDCVAYLNQRVGKFLIKDKKVLNNRFLYHYLLSNEKTFHFLADNGPQINLSARKILKVKIPIPHLEIQEEIVKILDKFTEVKNELENELKKEFENRKRQYEFYRNSLMNFGDDVEWKKLGEVSEIYDGTHYTPKYVQNGVKFVSVKNINSLYETDKFISVEDYNKFKIKPQKNDLFMTRIGIVGKSSIIIKNEPLAYYVSLALIRVKYKLLPKFLHYYIGSNFFKKELSKRTIHSAIPVKINLKDIGKCSLPIPNISQQEKIISILDRFDELNKEIYNELNLEIYHRKKQYEFFRKKLFSFKI